MSRLAEIYKQEAKVGGGLRSAVSKRIAEKIDPRQIFDKSGIIATMFPALKAYSAIKKEKEPKPSESSLSIDSSSFSDISAATKMTAKNTMTLPAMARDMNLMRLNIAKLVKLQGGTAATKADMFFKRAGERESIFEAAFGKMRGKSGGGGISSILGAKKRDGQSKESALFVEVSGSFASGFADAFMQALIGDKLSKMGAAAGGKLSNVLSKALPFLASATLPVLGIAGLAGLLYFLIKKDSGEAQTVDEMEKGGGYTPEQGGVAAAAAPEASDEELRKVRESMRASDDPAVRAAAAELDRQDALKKIPDQSEAETRRLSGYQAPSPTPTPTPETIPSNVVVSGTGAPIRTGEGGYVVSGEPLTPTPATAPTSTAPTPVAKAGSPIEESIKQALAQEGITDEKTQLAVMANIKKESGFTPQSENLSYSSISRLREVFPSYTKNLTDEQLKNYLKNPHALAELVYGNRMGNDSLGDAFKYRGRGFIQLTGKNNYAAMSKALGVDLVNNPDLANDPIIAARITARYLKDAKLRKSFQTQEEANKAVTQAIGGNLDLSKGYGATVLAKVNKYASEMSSGGVASASPSVTPSSSSSGATIASTSTSVADGQRQAMMPTSGGSTVIDNSTKTTVASAPSGDKTASAYNEDLIKTLIAAA